jgi:hypothetical protein
MLSGYTGEKYGKNTGTDGTDPNVLAEKAYLSA